VYVACSTLCFQRSTFEDALRSINALHFQKIDLAVSETGPHLKPSEIAMDVNKTAQYLRSTGFIYSAIHASFAAPEPDVYREQLKAVCRLGRLLTVPVVTIAAGDPATDLDEEVKRLTTLSKLAQAEGVTLAVETHRDTLTGDPAAALMLCERVPGLGLTLDPSHYAVGPHRNEEYDELFPFVKHVRLRDSSVDQFQVRIGQGHVEYGKIVTLLERENYERALTIDIQDSPEADYPIEPEVRKLKFLLESMV